jgi:hypothetical protein
MLSLLPVETIKEILKYLTLLDSMKVGFCINNFFSANLPAYNVNKADIYLYFDEDCPKSHAKYRDAIFSCYT